MATATERFECIGDLYYQRHHRLRPGKSEAAGIGRDSSSADNIWQFEQWYATHAFSDAIDRIVDLQEQLKRAIEGDALEQGREDRQELANEDLVKCGCDEYPECTHVLYWYEGFKAGMAHKEIN